ncbi:MAG: hypothetical protein AAFX06_19950 [Planctomycetota bacterium]
MTNVRHPGFCRCLIFSVLYPVFHIGKLWGIVKEMFDAGANAGREYTNDLGNQIKAFMDANEAQQ